MTKLAELKAAYAASTQGEWEPLMTCGELHVCTPVNEGCDVGTVCVPYERSDATFIALAHNNMAALLEAVVELGRFVEYLGVAGCDGAYDREIERAVNLLENLK